MGNYYIQKAVERINADYQETKLNGRYSKAIGSAVKDRIIEFCRQDEEFAEFVFDSDSTIIDCINDVGNKINSRTSISDIEVYKYAVQYYFPTADISVHMTIDLSGRAKEYAEETASDLNKSVLNVSFDDLFD